MDVSIIIVNYNTKKLTIEAINSVFNTIKNVSYEILVVDNASGDGSQEEIKETFGNRIRFFEMNDNLGFSKANNYAIKHSVGEHILLLNSDTIVIDDCIEETLRYSKDNKNVGVVGCKVLLKDNTLDKACRRGFPTPWNSFCYSLKLDKLSSKRKLFSGYNLEYLDINETNDVDCVMGAYMLIKREVIEKVGLLDETFFMYGEDIDWCYRIKQAGFRIVYHPKAIIYHYKKASSAKKRYKTVYEFHRAMILFYRKHYKDKYFILINFLVYVGIVFKFLIELIKNLFKL